MAFSGFECGLYCAVRKQSLDSHRENKAEFVIECDKSLIESRIVQAIERDSISDVQAFRFVITPRQNVRCDNQLTNGEPGKTATTTEVIKHNISEVILSPALFGHRDDFGLPGRRSPNGPDSFAGNDFSCLVLRFDKEGIETLLAQWNKFSQVGVELIPNLSVEVACTGKSYDAADL